MTEKRPGTLVISLDFELYWGMIDKVTLEEYGDNILGVRKAIPAMLALFKRYEIHATWATVGMLAFTNRNDLEAALPAHEPPYQDTALSPYEHLRAGKVGENEQSDQYHFGASLLDNIKAVPHQEIGSHTFSHLYGLDMEEDAEAFRADMEVAKRALSPWQTPSSLVFPRNQETSQYLGIAQAAGITAYRGNENHYFYRPRKEHEQTLLVKVLRRLDNYVNISGHHTYTALSPEQGPVNVPASRFLRPWSRALRWFEPLSRRRIMRAMSVAAQRGEVFHLWWHPHNFGTNLEENLATLIFILDHYKFLRETYGFESKTMGEVAETVL